MDLEQRTLRMQVIGKRERTKGLIFKRPEYLVALQMIDEAAKSHPTLQREVLFHEYSAVTVGDKIDVTMYTSNGHTWYFSREEAELESE